MRVIVKSALMTIATLVKQYIARLARQNIVKPEKEEVQI